MLTRIKLLEAEIEHHRKLIQDNQKQIVKWNERRARGNLDSYVVRCMDNILYSHREIEKLEVVLSGERAERARSVSGRASPAGRDTSTEG
jgi:hypothetical protein